MRAMRGMAVGTGFTSATGGIDLSDDSFSNQFCIGGLIDYPNKLMPQNPLKGHIPFE